MFRSSLLGLLCAIALSGCKRGDYQGPTDYAVPQRTSAELQALIAEQCTAARAADQPLLLEFSASWCSDCRTLAGMKLREPLLSTLANTVKLVEINVGDFERHEDLLELYDVDRIATWVLLRPTDCAAPISQWPVMGRRSVEPKSRGAPAQELVRWLAAGKR